MKNNLTNVNLVTYSQRCPGIDPAHFLREAEGLPRFYWQHNETVYAGFGIAAELTAWGDERFESIRTQSAELFHDLQQLGDMSPAQPRLFGGFSFRPDFITENTWASFAPAYFVLPHFQLTQSGGETWLTIN